MYMFYLMQSYLIMLISTRRGVFQVSYLHNALAILAVYFLYTFFECVKYPYDLLNLLK